MAAAVTRLPLLLLLCIASQSQQQVLAAPQEQEHSISVHSLLSSSTPASSAPDHLLPGTAAGTTLPIVRRAYSQSNGENKTLLSWDHFTAVLRRDRHRARSIHRRLAGRQTSTTTIPAHLGLAFHTYEYVVAIGVGTPARNLTVLFDTGSDLTWVQCAPCSASCYHQEQPLFDPSKSSSYAAIGCSSPDCQIGGGQSTGSGGSLCTYDVKYGDGSVTWGNLAKETFTLSPLSPPAAGVVFGCGERSEGFGDMAVAGLLDLGRGESSMVSQTRRRSNNGGVFSYCLPSRASYAGHLTFGSGAALPSSNLAFTPLTTTGNLDHTFYAVELVGISVSGAAPLPPPLLFSASAAIVDSGTVVTQLPSAAYDFLRYQFRRRMGRYTMLPEGTVEGLDTCYTVTGHDVVQVPRVALEFAGGATIDVDASGIMIVASAGGGVSVACLAFQPSRFGGLAIIGNMQQRTYNVVFDVAGGRVGFGPKGCS